MFRKRLSTMGLAGMLGAMAGLMAGAVVPKVAAAKRPKIKQNGLRHKEWLRRKKARKAARVARRMNRRKCS